MTSDNSLVRWNLNNYTTGTRYVHSLQLLEVAFPNGVYPINAYNNVLRVTQGGVAYSVTITPGNYSGITIAAALQVLLNAAGTGKTYTVTYVSSQQNLTITPSSGTFSLVVGTVNDAAYALGVSAAQSGTEAATFTTANPMNIGGTQAVDVRCNVSVDHISSTSSAGVLFRIPLKVDFGEDVFWEPQVPLILELTNPHMDHLSMRFFDDLGNPYVPAWENCHFLFTFVLSYQ